MKKTTKPKPDAKRLQLARTTIKQISEAHLKNVHGGLCREAPCSGFTEH